MRASLHCSSARNGASNLLSSLHGFFCKQYCYMLCHAATLNASLLSRLSRVCPPARQQQETPLRKRKTPRRHTKHLVATFDTIPATVNTSAATQNTLPATQNTRVRGNAKHPGNAKPRVSGNTKHRGNTKHWQQKTPGNIKHQNATENLEP